MSGKSIIIQRLTKRKIAVFAASFLIAMAAWFGACAHFSKSLTPEEKSERIDYKNGEGLARLKVYLDSSSAAGAAFCLSCAALIICSKLSGKRRGGNS